MPGLSSWPVPFRNQLVNISAGISAANMQFYPACRTPAPSAYLGPAAGFFLEAGLRKPKSGMWKALGALCALLLLAGAVSAKTTSPSSGQKKASSHSGQTKSAKSKSGKKKQASSRRGAWKRRGQQAIKEDRAREIQAALIREHYLTGEPSGAWDERTKKAMAKYQEDRGWQAKKLPDARALIQLGLGPNHDGLLNPESVASTERPSAAPPAAAVASPR